MKDTKAKSEKSEEKQQAKVPAERPWSNWIAVDNGDFFYRARQKPGGKASPISPHAHPSDINPEEWEYDYMAGYPSSSQGQVEVPHIRRSQVAVWHKPSIAAPGASTSAFSEYSQDDDYPVILGIDPEEATAALPPVIVEQEVPSGKTVSKELVVAHKHKKAEKPPEKKGKKKHGHGKKIGTVVSAEKNKRFNPKSKVQGWLDEWEPEE